MSGPVFSPFKLFSGPKAEIWGLLAGLLITLFLHLPHIQKDIISIHAWRQTQTQSNINNFYSEDPCILNPRKNDRGDGDGIYRMEFPLMQWGVAQLYRITGPHVWVTRITMLMTGFLSVLGMYALLRQWLRRRPAAFFGAWAFIFSPSFYYYLINPMPDNLALCAGIWGLYGVSRYFHSPTLTSWSWGVLLLAISALVKLPFILYFLFPAWILLAKRKYENGHQRLWMFSVLVMALLLPMVWYASVIRTWQGNGIVSGIFQYTMPWQDILYYIWKNLISVLPELLLNYAAVPFFLIAMIFFFRNALWTKPNLHPWLALSAVLIGYFLFEVNVITDVHDYYLFPFYPVLFLLVGFGAGQWCASAGAWKTWAALGLLSIMPLTAWLRMKDRWNPDAPGFNKDLLIHRDALRSSTPRDARVIAGNDISHSIFLYYIDRKGWAFAENQLQPGWMEDMIRRGATHLYSDTRAVDTAVVFQPMLDSLVLEAGSIRVFRLKAPEDLSQ